MKRRARRFWTPADLAALRKLYAGTPTSDLAKRFKRGISQVYAKAAKLGLSKSAEYLAGPHACRLRRGDNVGAAYRFPPGHVPANKGTRRPGWYAGRMQETQFKKGQRNGTAAAHYMPIGAERLIGGYVYVKVADVQNVAYTVNWMPLHILNWMRANGRPLPDGHVLCFHDRNRLNTAIGNLELITRAELGKRAPLHRYPKSLKNAIQMRGALNRRINRMEKEEERGKDA